MTAPPPDLVFLSYSRRDPDAHLEVRQRLLDRGLRDCLWDDERLRAGDLWDQGIRAAIDRAAVAVVVFGEGYFARRQDGGDYIVEQELPLLIERWRSGVLDLLPVYWSPSPHFKPECPGDVKSFCYDCQGETRSQDLHQIQAGRNRSNQDSPTLLAVVVDTGHHPGARV